MKAVTQSYKTGELTLVEAPPPQLQDGYVLVRTAHSLISAGTEKTKVDTAEKSLLGKAQARPDLVKQVINRARREGLWKTWQVVSDRLSTPLTMGYSSAGVVLDTRGDVGDIRPGDLVACAGNHAEVVSIPKNLVVPVPTGMPTEFAAFATVGAIAMQGVRQADARVGERILVIGLGLVGLLTTQILKAAGCRVFGLDLEPGKVALAKKLGCDDAAVASESSLEEQILLFSDGYGVDCTVITAGTSSNKPIEQAGEFTREKGRVVVLGGAKMDIPREPYYMKELEIRLSRSYGPGRYDRAYEEDGKDYPLAYVRFTERRNMGSFLELVAADAVRLAPMITHRFPIENAAAAYDIIRGEKKEEYLGIILEYRAATVDLASRVKIRNAPQPINGKIRLGVIGAGKYATANLLPHLRHHPSVVLTSICTGSGVTAVHVAEKFGFQAADADPDAIINESDAVLIATRHHHHSLYAIKALERGKAVFVEKPLAISREQLDAVVDAARTNSAMVGFNRRFAPAVQMIKEHLKGTVGPRQVLIRVNAGPIPKDHWIQDPKEGGGRLIGEGCHFVDLAVFLCESMVDTAHAVAAPQPGLDPMLLDNFSINLGLRNGSVATIVYTSIGDTGFPKEHVEVFAGGKVAVIHDFAEAELWANGKKQRKRWGTQDKGQQREIDEWIKSVREGTSLIPFDELVNVHRACLAAIESLRTGCAQKI